MDGRAMKVIRIEFRFTVNFQENLEKLRELDGGQEKVSC